MPDNAPKPILRLALTVLARIALALGVTLAVVMLVAASVRANPLLAVTSLFSGAFGSPYAWTETLLHATPILLTGLAVMWAFRAGLFNIGAEGQLLWGAVAACWVGSALRMPPLLHALVALTAGAAAGALWAWPAAALKARRGTPEVVSTLLLNWMALHLTSFLASAPLHDPEQQGARMAAVHATAWLATLPASRLHAGLLLALLLALGAVWLIRCSRQAFQARAVAGNAEAARSAGVSVPAVWTAVLLQSGALAGLAGAVEILGVHHFFEARFSPGYGYDGLVVAILGGNTPVGVVLAALFWGGLGSAAVNMEMELRLAAGTSRALVTMIQALVVLAVAVRHWPLPHWRRLAPQPKKGAPAD